MFNEPKGKTPKSPEFPADGAVGDVVAAHTAEMVE